jgi:hypothetical protein
LKHTSVFIQPTIAGNSDNKNFQMSVSSRFSGLHYTDVEKRFSIERESLTNNALEVFAQNRTHWFWEPSFAMRFGWKHFLFNTQFSKGVHLSKGDINTGGLAVSVGACFRFNLSKNK